MNVKRPDHYVAGRKYEPIRIIQDWQLCYELGCALKYIARAGRKEDAEEDIEKAKVYLDFFLDRIRLEKTRETADRIEQVNEKLNSVHTHWKPPWHE